MFIFLDEYYNRKKTDDLGALLGIITPNLCEDKLPADKASFNQWTACLKGIIARTADCDLLSVKESYNVMISFLRYYENEFGFDFKEVLNDLKTDSMKKEWIHCIKKIANKSAYD